MAPHHLPAPRCVARKRSSRLVTTSHQAKRTRRFKSVIASVAPCYRPLQAHSSHVIQRWVGLYSPLLKDHPFFKGGLLTEQPRHRQKDFLIFVAIECGAISNSPIDSNGKRREIQDLDVCCVWIDLRRTRGMARRGNRTRHTLAGRCRKLELSGLRCKQR